MKIRQHIFFSLVLAIVLHGCTVRQPRPPSHDSWPRKTSPARPAPEPYGSDTARMPETRDIDAVPAVPSRKPDNLVVAGLSLKADRLTGQGELARAAASIERGLRIAPKDASLWAQLANIRLLQRQFRQAESMAGKSIGLAYGDRELVRKNWRIIAEARTGLGDLQGAAAARQKVAQ